MKFIDSHHDLWRTVGGEDGPSPHPIAKPHQLLTLEQWHAVRDTWPADLPVGLTLPNTADVEPLEADLARFALIVLHFPKWVDGRAYSQAHILRGRYGFQGELRATGDVLVDMMPLMQRTGFSAVQMRHDQSIEAAERALGFFRGHYQADVTEPRPLFARPAAEALRPADEFVNVGAAI